MVLGAADGWMGITIRWGREGEMKIRAIILLIVAILANDTYEEMEDEKR